MSFRKEDVLKRLQEAKEKQREVPIKIPGMGLLDYVHTFLHPDLMGFGIGFANLPYRSGNVSLFELFTINVMVRVFCPKNILEFGTFDGRTTSNMYSNMNGDSHIYTVDLPKKMQDNTKYPLANGKHEKDDELGYIGLEDKLINEDVFKDHITQIWDDTANITKDLFEEEIDFIFIDASHSYENALNDSKTAFDIINKKRGIILWHDYSGWPGVTKALNQIFMEYPEKYTANFRHIHDTSIVAAYISED